MGAAFSFSTFASELGQELDAGSGSISFIFGCAMALLYGGGLFSGALADRIGTHRVAGAGALLCRGSLVAAGTVGTVWDADVTLGAGFGLGLAICYTPAVAAVQPGFDRNRGVASGIAFDYGPTDHDGADDVGANAAFSLWRCRVVRCGSNGFASKSLTGSRTVQRC
jgi:MFS family permease